MLQGIRNYHSGNGEEAYEYLNKVRKEAPKSEPPSPALCFSGVCFPLLHVRPEHTCICECRQDAVIRKPYRGNGFYWLQVSSPHLAERVGWLLSEPLPASRGRRRVQGEPRPLAAPSSTSGDFMTRKRGGNGSQPLPRSLAYFLLLPCVLDCKEIKPVNPKGNLS